MIYNDLVDVDEVVSGLSIKYPSVLDIEDIFFKLKTKQASL